MGGALIKEPSLLIEGEVVHQLFSCRDYFSTTSPSSSWAGPNPGQVANKPHLTNLKGSLLM